MYNLALSPLTAVGVLYRVGIQRERSQNKKNACLGAAADPRFARGGHGHQRASRDPITGSGAEPPRGPGTECGGSGTKPLESESFFVHFYTEMG